MSKEDGASKESRGMYGFDPSGLERAATAAKYLDSSKNAKNAFELALKEEELKALKEKKAIKYTFFKLI
jgi:ATPase family AAA domain-containing protein 3A/B